MINQSLLSNSLLSIEWIPFSSLCVCLQRQADSLSAYLDVLSLGGVSPSALGSAVLRFTDTPAAPGDPTGDEATEPVDKPHVYCLWLWMTFYLCWMMASMNKQKKVVHKLINHYCFIMPRFWSWLLPPSPAPPHFVSLSHLPTFLTWGAGTAHTLLSLQVFLVADGAHAVGAGITIETAAHSAKHWHLRLIGLLSHALWQREGGGGGTGYSWNEVEELVKLVAICLHEHS